MLLVVAMGVAAAGASQYAGAKHDIGLMRSLGLDPRQPVPEVSVGEVFPRDTHCSVSDRSSNGRHTNAQSACQCLIAIHSSLYRDHVDYS